MRHRPKRMQDVYSPYFMQRLAAMDCLHGEPRGSLYCPLCRRWVRHQQAGGLL